MDSAESVPQQNTVYAIAIGIDPFSMRLMREALPLVLFRELPMDISKLLKTEGEREPDLIFCGKTLPGVDLVDVATGVRSIYAESPLYYVCSEREGFNQQALMRNGFADAFLLPMDKGVLAGLVPDGTIEYLDVPLIDISPDTVLEFDTYIYLPMNNKFIRFSAGGYRLESERAKRLMDHEITKVYVSKDQLEAFQRFTANQLKNISVDPNSSEADRRQRMHKAVRALLSNVLLGNSTDLNFSEIVKTYFLELAGENSSLYEKMLKFTSSAGDAYAHVSNVSALATLLSLGLSVGKPEDVALAGLLHDIGMADVPLPVQLKTPLERTENEHRAYNEHPLLALKILRKRQIEISTLVEKIIEQHHERWDGKGYPKELRSKEILQEAQLLALADEIEYLTQVTPGKVRISVRDGIQSLMTNPGFDPDLLRKLQTLLG